ncbi:MAG: cell surface protein SprA [Saprospiraceae bacterium]|nr:cell surface protein SprA [Saprospiraceae bacterium]
MFVFVMAVSYMALGNLPSRNLPDPYIQELPIFSVDTIPLKDRTGDFITDPNRNPFDIKPTVITQKVEYDPTTGHYIILEKIGDEYYRTPSYMTFDEYMEWNARQQERRYFNTLAGIQSEKKSASGKINPMDKVDLKTSLVDRLFGGTEVNIKPQGSVELSLGWLYSRREDPNLLPNAQRQSIPDFRTNIKMNVDGSIGTKLKQSFNYDTQSTFDFDRQIKLAFDSDAFSEDDIIKKIEAGNVSFPLRGNLIQGAQSLFGFKTELQFGRLRITGLLSQQRSRQNNLKVESGATETLFEIYPDEYDENRHFFISHYNRDNYERALRQPPFINSSFQIAQIEVWVSDDRPEFQDNSTMVAAISDLGESDPLRFTSNPTFANPNCFAQDEIFNCLPVNSANNIYDRIVGIEGIEDIDKVSSILRNEFNFKQTKDFEVFRGRRLSPQDYTFHPKLGFISLNTRLRPNQVLGIAYNYYYTATSDTVLQVGQLSASSVQYSDLADTMANNTPKLHFVKLLKSTNQVTRGKNYLGEQVNTPLWDLMMKNVYPLRTSQLSQQDFEFDIFYEDDFADGSLKKFIPLEGLNRRPLLELFNLDRLNRYNDPQADGIFDYIPGVTVIERTGTIVFPILEPFGKSLAENIGDSTLANIFTFQELYDTTISIARQSLEKNKFVMKGRVRGSTSGEIALGPFVPRGSVRVNAGGRLLVEGIDYEIDYNLGRLRIINEAYLGQGTPINVSYEDNTVFSLQQKNMSGIRAEYQFNKKSSLGMTYLKLAERPFTQKVNIGDDPINNRIFGLDFNYSNEANWVTKLVDKLPFYSTKEKSNINFTAEGAALVPGHAGAINFKYTDENGKEVTETSGVANIDDFEGAITAINLGGFNPNIWSLASTPPEFREHILENDLTYGANRAKLSWYVIDQGTRRSAEDQVDPYTRIFNQQELFPFRTTQPGQQQLFTFDMSYYPSERGPYNFDTRGTGIPGYTSGFSILNNQIRLNNPKSRWGGIMRYFQNADFEAANYEFIEFWMLNPFMDRRDGEVHSPNEEGEIVFNLGNVSEDVLKDNFLFFENAIPTSQRIVPTVNTAFGKATVSLPLVNGFDLSEGPKQDLGFDGINDEEEQNKFRSWLIDNDLQQVTEVFQDPANDNFVFFNDSSLETENNLLNRFKNFNGPEGNAPLNNAGGATEFVRGNRYPDTEDLNNNKSLDQAESYYEYRVKIKNNNGELDTLNLDFYRQTLEVPKENGRTEKWYQFQIPINKGTPIGDIAGFRSIQFMRLYMTNFESAKTFRLAQFQILRSQWRKQDPICFGPDAAPPGFSVDDVGFEENSSKTPFPYRIPKGIVRQQTAGTIINQFQDEKSMALIFNNLSQNCEVSVSKLARVNLNLYKRIQMFVHAEHKTDTIEDKKLAIFLRVGKDFVNNYYEYVLPLTMSKLKGDIRTDSSSSNIWPNANFVNLPLDSLVELKRIRYRNSLPFNVMYGVALNEDRGDSIKIIGNPSLGAVKVFQVGVRNITTGQENFAGEVWINELRVLGFDEEGGVAAQARLQIQMADLGEINGAMNYSSIGFGALDKRLMERNRSETFQYEISTNLDVGKVLPKGLQLTVPFYAQYSKTQITPQFDPFDLDLEVDEKLEVVTDPAQRQQVLETAREQESITTFNFTNVKTKAGGTGKPWSPSNVGLSYSYSETTRQNPIIKEDKTTNQSLSLDYAYNRKTTYIEPFKFIKVKALKFISEFNFSILPNNFAFNSKMNRVVNNRTFRLPDTPVFRFDDLRFSWERNYVLDWDLTKSLRFNFRANSNSLIDELRQVGIADNPDDRDWVNERGENVTESVNRESDFVRNYRNNNLRRLGRSKNYKHNFSLNYRLPFKSIPILDWIQATADYKADYGWDAGPLIEIDLEGNQLGNIIRNSQNVGANATFDFSKLYSKWGYLKSIETGKAVTSRTNRNAPGPARDRRVIKPGDKKEDLDAAPLLDKDGKVVSPTDKQNADKVKKEKEDKPRDPTIIERILIRPLLSIRSVKISYKEDFSTMIPGFMPQTRLLGQSDGFSSPGWGFISGAQPNLRGQQNWLTDNQEWFNPSLSFNDALNQTKRHTADVKILIEPFKDFSIDVNFNKNYSENHSEVFRRRFNEPDFRQLALYDFGSWDASYYALNTLFDNSFELYNKFKLNREVISSRLPNVPQPGVNPTDPNFVEGYGPLSNAVNVPAFIAAYTGKNPYDIELDQQALFAKNSYIPKPNWQLNYNGLTKIKSIGNIFSNLTVKHGYRSSIRVSRFETQPNYNDESPFGKLSPNDNYYTRFEIPSVSISEQFVPIIGINLKTKSDLKFDFEYKMTRSLELGISQLREAKSTEIVVGAGYVITDFKGFGSKKKERKKKPKEGAEPEVKDPATTGPKRTVTAKGRDLKFNLSYSLRDDESQVYDLLAGTASQADRGSKAITLNPNIEYDVNKNLSVRFYFDYQRIIPKTTISFPITTIRSGFTLRFFIN